MGTTRLRNRGKTISKFEYYKGWAKEGFPKRIPGTKAYVVTKKRRRW